MRLRNRFVIQIDSEKGKDCKVTKYQNHVGEIDFHLTPYRNYSFYGPKRVKEVTEKGYYEF